MKLFRPASLIMTFILCTSIAAGQEFAYDVDFKMNFDNREYYKSNFSRSMTIFGARLTPSAGISIDSEKDMNHRIMLGLDIMKDFGASPISEGIAGNASQETAPSQNNTALLREIILYYRLQKKSGNNTLELYAGIFPRHMMEGSYSTAFFSDSLLFYDNNIEGLLVKWNRPKSKFELGCDWMGQFGQARREKFMIFSSGSGRIAPVLSLGYSAYMYHFACSQQVDGVVDNMLVNPYIEFEFGQYMNMQNFLIRIGWLQAFQHDRLNVGHYVFPGGGEFDIELRKWNAGVRNRLFLGTDMMPYYNSDDAGGIKYGNRLYMGDPFYRIHDDGSQDSGMYDRLDIFYEPHIGRYLKIRLSAIFHFNNFNYSGCQQMVSLNFNLQELLQRRK